MQDTNAVVWVARRMAEEGLQAVTFDYRGFGRSGGAPRQVLSIPAQLADVRSVLAHVRTMPGVDAYRLALWGTSLGGAHALTVAAADDALAAVVTQVPFNGVPRKVEGRSPRTSLALLWAAFRDRWRGRVGREPIYVKAVGEPGELAVMTGPDVVRTVRALTSETWENRVAPRGLLDMMGYRPGREVARIRAALLVCVATQDRETPAETTRGLAVQAPRGSTVEYDVTHFDIYRPGVRERVLRDQVGFLRSAFALR
ncbi:alpha/beta fold hydrolase [Nocardioides sp. TF02-7]|nr:alpha/beta fold hydrolase [Nocardioides sp. TF02-7]